MQSSQTQKVIVLGGGNFGTCLAQHLAHVGHNVKLWARRKEVTDSINKNHRNPHYLNTVKLSENLKATSNLDDGTLDTADVVVLAIPTQFLRGNLENIAPKINENQLIVSAAKGIEVGTLKLPEQIMADTLGEDIARKAVSLSGPSFAIEVATHQPTAVSAASHDQSRAEMAQSVFHAPFFRVYTSNDPLGLELAGALKNVIAIASGACHGLGYQANSRAALITRGLAEMARIGTAMGADPFTFKSLGGVGDLFLTCSSEKSRNFTVGKRLGEGETLTHILETLGSVAEGVKTTNSAKMLTDKIGVDAPIINAVYGVLYNDQPIKKVVAELLNRDAKPERT